MKPLTRAALMVAVTLSTSVVISQVANKATQTQRTPQFENEDGTDDEQAEKNHLYPLIDWYDVYNKRIHHPNGSDTQGPIK